MKPTINLSWFDKRILKETSDFETCTFPSRKPKTVWIQRSNQPANGSWKVIKLHPSRYLENYISFKCKNLIFFKKTWKIKKNPKKVKKPKKIILKNLTKNLQKKKAAGDLHLSIDCLFRRSASTIKLLFSLSIKKFPKKSSKNPTKKSKNEEKDKKHR